MGATLRKDGKWWRVTLHRHRKRKCWLYQDQRVASLKAKEFDYRLAMEGWGFWAKPPGETFGTYAERQVALWEQGALKPSTAMLWKGNLTRYLLPTLGHRSLEEISRAELKEFFAKLVHRGLKRYTLQNILAPLRRILQEAVEDGRLTVNPASNLGRQVFSRLERPAESHAYLPEQARQLLRTCASLYPDRYPLLLCLLQTGVRPGEALALEWSDVNWTDGTLTVRGTLYKGRKYTPKTGRVHLLTMTRALRTCLEALYLKQQMAAAGTLPAWIFSSRTGGPLDRHNLFARWWRPLLKAAGLPYVRPYDLRASVVSLLLNEGLTPWEVQTYIGHRSLVMTCNTYGHRYPGSSRVEDALTKFVPELTTSQGD
ncbi:MAG TPA: site-specific integrase [Nitrospira sp.]|nr:site-specific integrase [Nitrospira sp.]